MAFAVMEPCLSRVLETGCQGKENEGVVACNRNTNLLVPRLLPTQRALLHALLMVMDCVSWR